MKVYCAWCKKLIRDVPAPGYPENQDHPISHGFCPECLEKMEEEEDEDRRQEPNRQEGT